MLHLEKAITAKEIRNSNLTENCVLSHDFQNGMYFLCINSVRKYSFKCSSDVTKSVNKIKKMGFGFGTHEKQLTDEEEGLIQATKNGENPFAYSIICANPKLNKIVK